MFDKDRTGTIEVKDLETIMGSLQRDPNEIREFVDSLDPNSNGKIGFDEFLDLMQMVENRIVKSGADETGQPTDGNQENMSAPADQSRGLINVAADSKVLDFLRLLEEYRRKCEEQGNYAEA